MSRTEGADVEPVHFIRRWVSFGDVITLVASLVVFSFGFGALSKDVDAIKVDVATLKNRDITPGAQNAISVLQATDVAQNSALTEMRQDMRETRKEIMTALAQIDAKLDAHMDGQHR